jgi:hypothetical protein
MIAGLPFAFGAPAILFGLLALPVIWWLLRLTPPRPQAEPFAPLAILARVLKPEETPCAQPLVADRPAFADCRAGDPGSGRTRPQPARPGAVARTGLWLSIIDNGWASAPDWDARVEAAEMLIARPRTWTFRWRSSSPPNRRHDATPTTFERARDQLRAAKPQPLRPERAAPRPH